MSAEELKKKYPLFQRECNLCGTPLAFGMTHDGKTIPLDLRAPVYTPVFQRSDGHSGLRVVRTELAFVSHFTTCAYADEFSKKNPNT